MESQKGVATSLREEADELVNTLLNDLSIENYDSDRFRRLAADIVQLVERKLVSKRTWFNSYNRLPYDNERVLVRWEGNYEAGGIGLIKELVENGWLTIEWSRL